MFKLTVISGPNKGINYKIEAGVSTIGRQNDNTIVLASDRVSKKHCSILVEDHGVTLKDEGSSNGTFVNGGLIRSKAVKAGDRISVGEFVLQLVEVRAAQSVQSNAIQNRFESKIQNTGRLDFSTPPKARAPSDLKGKLAWFLDHTLMPIIYSLAIRTEWRLVCLGFMLVLTIGNLGLSTYPLLETNRLAIVQEIKVRAQLMARQIADQNAPFLAAGAETKAEVGVPDRSDGVQVAVLVDLDNRILAPSTKINQYLTNGFEAVAAVQARDLFRAGRETGLARVNDAGIVVSIEPVKVLSPALGKNVVTAMAVVSIDSTFATPGAGEIGIIYFQTLILTSIFGLLIFYILYKLTMKPFLTLNEDMDRALKGELPQVTHEYKIEELDSLWEIINSAIQRIPKKTDSGLSSLNISSMSESGSIDEYEWPIKMLGNLGKLGIVAFGPDKRITHLNSIFEEISGIRKDGAVGQEMSTVARDQSLGLFTEDLLGRVGAGSEGVSEDFDFNGLSYKVHVSAFGGMGQAPRYFLMVLERNE
jgi:hypothetical protein